MPSTQSCSASFILKDWLAFLTIFLVSISAARAQSDIPVPAIPVPPPEPLSLVAPPLPPPILPTGAALDRESIERLKPRVQAFRNGSDIPQIPARNGNHFSSILVPTNESVLVQFQFGSALAGKSVRIIAVSGVTLDLTENKVSIGQRGELVLQVTMLLDAGEGQLSIFVENIGTVLHFSRASSAKLEGRERASKGGAR